MAGLKIKRSHGRFIIVDSDGNVINDAQGFGFKTAQKAANYLVCMENPVFNHKPGRVLNHPCPECGKKMVLKKSKYGPFYGCVDYPNCRATHGADRDTGDPLGVPVNQATRAYRMLAHDAFDKLWDNKTVKRSFAYLWLSTSLGVDANKCHIGQFDIEQCKRVIEICEGTTIEDIRKSNKGE